MFQVPMDRKMKKKNRGSHPMRQSDKYRSEKLTLHPLSVEDALQAAMETGPPPSRVRGKPNKNAAKNKRPRAKHSKP